MAKLHSASPRAITQPFPHAIIPKLHSKACDYLYKYMVSLFKVKCDDKCHDNINPPDLMAPPCSDAELFPNSIPDPLRVS